MTGDPASCVLGAGLSQEGTTSKVPAPLEPESEDVPEPRCRAGANSIESKRVPAQWMRHDSSVTYEPLPLVSWVNGEMELAELMTDPDEPEKRSVVWGS